MEIKIKKRNKKKGNDGKEVNTQMKTPRIYETTQCHGFDKKHIQKLFIFSTD